MPRNLGTVTDAILAANTIEYWNFVSINGKFGILYLTDRPNGFVGNIDGTTKTWSEAILEVGPITQGRQQVFQVNWIKLANLDYTWTNLAYSPGLRNAMVNIYTAWWNVSVSPSVFAGAYKVYQGRIDDMELSQYAQFSLAPHHSPWTSPLAQEIISDKCINTYRHPMDCQYLGQEPAGESTCGKTRTNCADRNNMIHINIFDDSPSKYAQFLVGGIVTTIPPAEPPPNYS